MSYRVDAAGHLEIQHPETQSYAPVLALLEELNGHKVRLNTEQQALLAQLADALIRDRGTVNAQAYLASLSSLLNAININIDEVEPDLKAVRAALDAGSGNTAYARLADLLSTAIALNTQVAGISTYVDGVETLLTTANTLITTINNNTLVTVINGLTAINNALTTVNTKLPVLALGQQAMTASVSTVIASDQTAIPVKPPAPATDFTSNQASVGGAIKAAAGRLFALSCSNFATSVRYLQLFNTTNGPTGTPAKNYPVYPMNSNGPGFLVLDRNFFSTDGLNFTTGISWGFSSTPITYTAGANSECVFEARYT